jgi:hypothetical protein
MLCKRRMVELGIAPIMPLKKLAEALFYSSNPSIGAHVSHPVAYELYLVIVRLYLAKPLIY